MMTLYLKLTREKSDARLHDEVAPFEQGIHGFKNNITYPIAMAEELEYRQTINSRLLTCSPGSEQSSASCKKRTPMPTPIRMKRSAEDPIQEFVTDRQLPKRLRQTLQLCLTPVNQIQHGSSFSCIPLCRPLQSLGSNDLLLLPKQEKDNGLPLEPQLQDHHWRQSDDRLQFHKPKRRVQHSMLSQEPVMCSICNVPFMTTFHLLQHQQGKKHRARLDELHGRKKKVKMVWRLDLWCQVCNVYCVNEYNLLQHNAGKKHMGKVMRLKTDTHSWCDICDIVCMNEYNLAKHLAGKKHAGRVLQRLIEKEQAVRNTLQQEDLELAPSHQCD